MIPDGEYLRMRMTTRVWVVIFMINGKKLLTIQKFMLKYSRILQRNTKKKQPIPPMSERGQ